MGGLVYAYDNMLTEDGIRTSAVALGRVTGARKTGTGKASLIVSGNSTYPEVLDYRLTVSGTNVGSVVQVFNPPRKVPGFKGQGVTMTDITVDGTGIFTPPAVGSLFAKCLFPAVGSERIEVYSIFGDGEHLDEDGEPERGMGVRQRSYGPGVSLFEIEVKPQDSEMPLRSYGTMILAEVPKPREDGYDVILAAVERESIWLGPLDVSANLSNASLNRVDPAGGTSFGFRDVVTGAGAVHVLSYKNTPEPRVGSCIQIDCFGKGFDIGTLGFQFYRIDRVSSGFGRIRAFTEEGTITGLSGTYYRLTLDRKPAGTFSTTIQSKVHLLYNSSPQGTFAAHDYCYFGSTAGTVDPSVDNSSPFFLYDIRGVGNVDNVRQRITLNLKQPRSSIAFNGFGGTAGMKCYWVNKDGEDRDYRLRMQVNTYADMTLQKTYDYVNAGGFPITTAADVQRVVNFGGWKEDGGNATFEDTDDNIEVFSAGVFDFRREKIGIHQPQDLRAATYNVYSMGWGSSIRNGQIHLFPSFVGYGLYDLADGEFVARRKAGTRDVDNWYGTYLSFTINDPDYNSQAGDKFVAQFVPMFNEVGGATYDIEIDQIGTLQSDVKSSTSNVKAPFGHNVRFVRAPGKDLELNDKWEWKGQHVYGKNRLLDLKRDTTWRSNGIDGTIIIDFDAGSVIYPNRIIVHDHNLSSTGSLWIQNMDSVSARGTFSAFHGGSVLIDTNKSWTADEWIGKSIWITSGSWRGSVFEIADNTGTALKLKYGKDIVSYMFRGESYLLQWSSPDYEAKIPSWNNTSTASVSGQSSRYWRIQVWDPDNTDGEVRIGGIFLGRQFAPSSQPVRPYSRPAIAKASRVETSSGHESSYVFSRRREYQITYNKILDVDYDGIISMWEHSFTPGRGIRPFYMIQDSDASGSTKLVYFSDNSLQDSYMHFTDIGFRLREVTKST